MIPKIIHYCWFGEKEIPEKYSNFIEDWKKLHPEWNFMLWDESNCPRHIPYIKNALANQHWANLSNLIRLFALKEYGGIYLDIDIKLIKPLDSLTDQGCFLGFEEGSVGNQNFWINNAIIGAELSHPLILLAYRNLIAQFDGTEQANLSGPRLITKILQEEYNVIYYGFQQVDDITIYPKEYFYPIHYSEVYKVQEIEKHITPETYAVHIWARTWLDNSSLLNIIDELYLKIHKLESEAMNNPINEINFEVIQDSEIHNHLNSLVENIKQNNSGISFIKNVLANCEIQVNNIEKHLVHKNEHLSQIEKANTSLIDQVANREHRLQELNNSLFSRNEELIKLEAHLKAAHARITDCQKSEAQLKKRSEELVAREEVLQKDFKEFIKSKEEEIKFLKDLYLDVSNKYKKLSEKENAVTNKLHLAELSLLQHNLTIRNLESRVSQVKEKDNSINELQKKLKTQESTITNLENQTTDISNQYLDIQEKLQKSQNDLKKSEAIITELQNELNNSTARIELTLKETEKTVELLKAKLQEEKNNNKSYSKAIKWYQETYEHRSLAGILKERLSRNIGTPLFIQNRFKGYHKIKKSRKKNLLSKKILCTIVNHNSSGNAKKLSSDLSEYFNTIVFDSGSKDVHHSFVKLGNVYYSGLLNNAYNCAKELGYEYIFFICSDVEFAGTEIHKMYQNLSEINLGEIGIYSPSSTGRSHSFCKKIYEKGLRSVPFTEGFVFLADLKILDHFLPIDLHVNQYGWGPDIANGYFARTLDKLCVIDDGVSVYHPESTGYSNQKAEDDMWHWLNSFSYDGFKKFFKTYINLIRSGNTSKYKVSVIIPCYNQAGFLSETIQSLLLQDYTNLEILIINDGSTDETETLALEFAAKYPQIKYFTKPNGGLGNTRNFGLTVATGELIQFLDCDDLLSKDKILSQVYDMINHTEIDISYTPYICFEDGNKNNTWTYSRVALNNDPLEDLIDNWENDLSIPIHCFLYKKTLINDIRFDEQLPNHEDWHFHIQVAAKKKKYAFLNEGIAYYRVRNNSMARDLDLMKTGKEMCIKKSMRIEGVTNQYQEKLKRRSASFLITTSA